MKSFVLVLLCVYSASADVNELLHKPEPHTVPHHLPNPHAKNAPSGLELIYENVQVEEPESAPLSLLNEGVEIVEAFQFLPQLEYDVKTVQLTDSHPDYQGPYHYQKPKVQLLHEAPESAPEAPIQATRFKVDYPETQNDYLPPSPLSENTLAKRHAKLGLRRRV